VALQATWAEILVETASSFHGLDSPSKAALRVAPFQLEGSSTEESEFERVRFSEHGWRYSKTTGTLPLTNFFMLYRLSCTDYLVQTILYRLSCRQTL
jgi:hypothetical protein